MPQYLSRMFLWHRATFTWAKTISACLRFSTPLDLFYARQAVAGFPTLHHATLFTLTSLCDHPQAHSLSSCVLPVKQCSTSRSKRSRTSMWRVWSPLLFHLSYAPPRISIVSNSMAIGTPYFALCYFCFYRANAFATSCHCHDIATFFVAHMIEF